MSKDIIDRFKGYNLYNSDDYKNIWDNAIIVLDTNILLNFYRYSKNTRNELFKVFNNYKNRIWIPYQVLKEYYKNRDNVIEESQKYIFNLEDSINRKLDEISNEIKKYSKKIESTDKLNDKINNYKDEISKLFNDIKSKDNSNDNSYSIEEKILKLIGNRYEEPFEYSDIEDVIKEGNNRIVNELPPGYNDNDKSDRFGSYAVNGDYIIFDSIVKYSSKNNKDIILVTDDNKEDIFQKVNGKIIGGRRELLQEFYEKTGKLLLMYSSEGFINKFNELNPGSINHEAMKEIENYNNIRHFDDIDGKGYFFFNFEENDYNDSDKISFLEKIMNSIIRLICKYNDKMINTDKKMLFEDILECSYKIQFYYTDYYKEEFDELLRKSHELEKYISFCDYYISYDISCDIKSSLRRLIRHYKDDIVRGPIYKEL